VISSEVEITRDELISLIDADGFGIAGLLAHPFQGLHDIFTAIVKSWINDRRELREDVDNRRYPLLLSCGQLVTNKVHRPCFVRAGSFDPHVTWLSRPLGQLLPQLQA
jgi:hypothetical protein